MVKCQLSIDANCEFFFGIKQYFYTYAIWEIINDKMYITPLLVTLLLAFINGIYSKSVELTFELPDSAVECFYQEIEKNTSAALEYQVNYDRKYFS